MVHQRASLSARTAAGSVSHTRTWRPRHRVWLPDSTTAERLWQAPCLHSLLLPEILCTFTAGNAGFQGYNGGMNVRVTMNVAGRQIDQILSGANADEILASAKAHVAKELGWKGLFLSAMTPLAFAQKAVELYNGAHQSNFPPPKDADEFLRLGQQLGYLTLQPEDERRER